jgi:glycosyltransferase involved in cell wall biosynthesis
VGVLDINHKWLIVAGDFTRSGGMDRANYHLAWHLAERSEYTVHLAAHEVAEPLASHANVRVHRASRPLGSHTLGEFALRRVGRRIARHLTISEPGTRVIVNGGNCSWPDINWVHMVHHACETRDADAPLAFRLRNHLALRMARRQERKILRGSRFIIANSGKTRRDLVEHFKIDPDCVDVIYLGVDAEEFGPITPQERAGARVRWQADGPRPVFVFVGALGYDQRKGFDTLLDAVRLLREQGVMQPRVLAAGGGTLEYWHQQIARRGLSEYVRLLGQVSDAANLLAAADLLVSPSRFEPYGLAVHEALCRGIPALVTRTAGIAERYPNALRELLLQNADDAVELAERMRYWHAHAQELAAATADFGSVLRSWTWDDMAAAIADKVDTVRPSAMPIAVGSA